MPEVDADDLYEVTDNGDGTITLGEYGSGEVVLPSSPYPDVLGDWGGRRPEVVDTNFATIQVAEQLAWDAMIRLTAYQVVVAPVTVRPMCQRCASNTWLTDPAQFFFGAAAPWDAMMLRGFGSADWCGAGHRIIPLSRPVGRIVEVKIDGAVFDPVGYRVDNGNELVRTDGESWPTQQSPWAVGSTFEITYYPGYRPDTLFVWAVGQLAWEFFLSIAPPSALGSIKTKCRLPAGVTNVVRQGVSYDIANLPFTNGRTGIVEIDTVLARYNPNGLTARPTVASVDTLRRQPRLIGR